MQSNVVRRTQALTTSVEDAGRLLGLGRGRSYEAARDGSFPVPIMTCGRRYMVPLAPLASALGVSLEDLRSMLLGEEHRHLQ